jgi:hypothetical protein
MQHVEDASERTKLWCTAYRPFCAHAWRRRPGMMKIIGPKKCSGRKTATGVVEVEIRRRWQGCATHNSRGMSWFSPRRLPCQLVFALPMQLGYDAMHPRSVSWLFEARQLPQYCLSTVKGAPLHFLVVHAASGKQ